MLHRHAGPAVAGSYTAGAIAGALTTAGALLIVSGLLSPIPAQVRSIAAALTLVLLTLRALGILCLDLPQRAYQIPRETFGSSPRRAAFSFAYQLGTGVRTYITATAPYALAVLLLVVGPATLGLSVVAAAAAAAGYGLGRCAVVATQSIRNGIAVEPPTIWLRTADIVATGGALIFAMISLA